MFLIFGSAIIVVTPVRASIFRALYQAYQEYFAAPEEQELIKDRFKDPTYIPTGYQEVQRVEQEKIKSIVYSNGDNALISNMCRQTKEGPIK